MIARHQPNLLSPGAAKLLMVLTPEPAACTERQAESATVCELQRLGLVEVKWVGPAWSIFLTKAGLAHRPSLRN